MASKLGGVRWPRNSLGYKFYEMIQQRKILLSIAFWKFGMSLSFGATCCVSGIIYQTLICNKQNLFNFIQPSAFQT